MISIGWVDQLQEIDEHSRESEREQIPARAATRTNKQTNSLSPTKGKKSRFLADLSNPQEALYIVTYIFLAMNFQTIQT